MEVLIILLFVLLFILVIVTVVGHAIWLLCSWAIGSFTKPDAYKPQSNILSWRCEGCNSEVRSSWTFCGQCGLARQSDQVSQALRKLSVTEDQIDQFHQVGKLDRETFLTLKSIINRERIRLKGEYEPYVNVSDTPAYSSTPEERETKFATEPSEEFQAVSIVDETEEVVAPFEPVPSFLPNVEESAPRVEPPPAVPPPPPPRTPRRSFSEMLNSFMEESNIRWGEIIGGLLIIGCSTALVVSLWSQISQIPVLKFLIFTTVTAVLFGIGMYTEHRWKLPTTSRGILTIATLLVPLNFLAIAAVSSGDTSGVLVLASELLAPAIFLCLVYFAGRIITPGCAHLLAAGVLASSVGQLLVRHFAGLETSPETLILLGAFPVISYVVTIALALRGVLHDGKVDEPETTMLFTLLGAMSFAALLPFGLLLYKSGPIDMSMMYLAPLVSLWGVPMLATGAVIWRRIEDKKLAASRTAGTALGILGLMIAVAGMILAWPNPASLVPASILNFAILTALAVILELPIAHLLAAGCLTVAYLVSFHVFAGHLRWQNLRVASLVQITLDISSGQALLGAFAIFLVASEWLRHIARKRESDSYLVSACIVAAISLFAFSVFGPLAANQLENAWIIYFLYTLGALWIGCRRSLSAFIWGGTCLFAISLGTQFSWDAGYTFPWQTALLVHASICMAAAVITTRRNSLENISQTLNYSALISLVLAVVSFFQTNPWQVTSMQAERVFWIAGILLLSLWLNRYKFIFASFQIAVTAGSILTVKAVLQQYDWYTYLPHAFMHPAALQIQGTVLVLLCLGFIGLRFIAPKFLPDGIVRSLDVGYSVERLMPWVLLVAFIFLSVYGAVSGLAYEFALGGSAYQGWNIAGFPHQEAYGLGSWIILGLLTVLMLTSAWERRKQVYLFGALLTVSAALPLIAARFETQVATATAWRFLAAVFLVIGSVVIWSRNRIQLHLDWPQFLQDSRGLAGHFRLLLISLTAVPLLLFTLYPALRAIAHAPLLTPQSGIFFWFSSDLSYAIPLVAVSLVLVGYAVRERLPDFNFYSALVIAATVTLAYVLSVVSVDGPMDSTVLVRVAQLNAITIAIHALVWQVLRKKWLQALECKLKMVDWLIRIELGMAVAINALLLGPLTLSLIVVNDPGDATRIAGSLIGWLALGITALTVVFIKRSFAERLSARTATLILLSVACLSSFAFVGGDNALELRVLAVGTTLTAWVMFLVSFLRNQNQFGLEEDWWRAARSSSALIGGAAIALTLRVLTVLDGTGYWWTIIPMIALAALGAALQATTHKHRYLYAAGILTNIATTIWWLAFQSNSGASFISLLEVNLVVACLTSLLWLFMEVRARGFADTDATQPLLPYHTLVVIFSLMVLTVIALYRFNTGFLLNDEFTWHVWVATACLMFATLWDRSVKYSTAGLYVLGLVAGALTIQEFELSVDNQLWSAMMFLACYSLVIAILWRKRTSVLHAAERLRITSRIEPTTTELPWLAATIVVSVLAVGSISYWVNLRFFAFDLRLAAAFAVVAQAITFGLLAEGAWSERWRRASIATLVAGLVLFAWSWLTPLVNATWLNRSVILMVLVFALVALYGIFLDKVRDIHAEWSNSLKACVPVVLSGGLLALAFCLSTEVFYQLSFGAVRIPPTSLFAIGITLVSAVIVPVWFALSPQHDPLSLQERGRMKYVYVAEFMLALLFLHIRLTMPWLFTGFFEDYWPFVVMAIAYLGVVASESLRRRNIFVLAKPMERTGAFLPLLPVLGFWLATSQVDYSTLLFIVGGLYGLLSILRRSFIFGALAGVSGNAALWYVLHRTDNYQFLQHPQLWLIPLALSVLLAAYLNEEKLSEDQLAGVRYLSLVTIYVSSTADIFINGVANSPWLPLILGAFSLAGVFSGIMFRIRGLLLMGSVFLLLSIVTMIWYASANFGWTWLWYVAGIATGATIIFMFAIFEKKRGEVLRVVDGLKDWEI